MTALLRAGRGTGLPRRARWALRLLVLELVILFGSYGALKVGATVLIADQVASFPNGQQDDFVAGGGSAYLVLVDSSREYNRQRNTERGVRDATCLVETVDGQSGISGIVQVLSIKTVFGDSVGYFRAPEGPVTVSCETDQEQVLAFGNDRYDDYSFRVLPVHPVVITYVTVGVWAMLALVLLTVVFLVTGLRRGSGVGRGGTTDDPRVAQGLELYEAYQRGELPGAGVSSGPHGPSGPQGPPWPPG